MRQKTGFQIVLCPGRFPEQKYTDVYSEIYRCWHEVWSQTFEEVDKNPLLYSDAFTRQDVIAAIMHEGECKAVSLHRYTHQNAITTHQDSYFANWSEIHIKKLCKPGPDILVSSYFTIHASARGGSLGIAMKDYLLALTTEVFLNSGCDTMTGAARKSRKVHDVTYAWGAVPVGIDVPSGHSDLVDLVAFFKPEVLAKRFDHEIIDHFYGLWENRLIIKQENLQDIDVFEPTQHTDQRKKAA